MAINELKIPSSSVKVVDKKKAEIPVKKKETFEEIVRALEEHMKKTQEERKRILAQKTA